VDDHLRSIVQQALRRNPDQRLQSAQAMLQALQAWLQASPGSELSAAGTSKSTLDFLLRRMRHKSDFPALSDSVVRIQRLADSDTESVGSLTNEILKDVALTNKLLRLVNSAHFSHAGGGSISTVSRAVALVGFNGIRNMALGLVLLDHMQDKVHANLLREELLRCLMAGSVAAELCSSARDSEDAFIGAMFQNLGRLLTDFYFPEEARQVRTLLAGDRDSAAEQVASNRVLGLSFEDLGVGVARAWGLPESLQRCMRKPLGKALSAQQPQERLRWLALAANDVADTLLHTPPDLAEVQIRAVAERHARTLGMAPAAIQQATTQARQKLAQMAHAMQLRVLPGTLAQRLLSDPTALPAQPAADATPALCATALESATAPAPENSTPARQAADIMVAGIQDITGAMVESAQLNEVIRMVLETVLRALGCRHIVFCLRDVKTDCLIGRIGLGVGVESVIPTFRIPLKNQADLFSLVCAKGSDTLISDASDPLIAARLPSWYQTQVHAPTFLLLPLQLKGSTFALIYADSQTQGGIALDEKQLSLLRTLRNQAVMAFRHAG
jgi:HD-like signal output (HDOD) protein